MMGKNNRQRRSAKARKRSRPRPGPRPRSQPSQDRPPRDRAKAEPDLARRLEEGVAWAWRHGWQPTDLDRLARRRLDRRAVEALRRAIGREATSYAELGRRVAPAWMDQLDAIGSAPGDPGPSFDDEASVRAGVEVLALLLDLPPLPELVDPPHTWNEATSAAAGHLPAAVLDRVRALLAKAESTTFEAEAEAFTAKAQELMARYRIDRAVVGQGDPADEPIARRIGVDDPYADAKSVLLSEVAAANGGRAVWSRELGSSTVFGYPGELDAIEELFTSLLVQATAALRREGPKEDGYGRSRTKSFRRSFLLAFAHRIGERLRQTVADTIDEVATQTGTALVPLLSARDDAVDAATEAAFTDLGSYSPRASDGEGWIAGRIFGDRADLSLGPPIEAA
jgi:hypothetical protein